MSSAPLRTALRAMPTRLPIARSGLSRAFQTSARRLDTAPVVQVRRPVGAFRGGMFGFLLGSSVAAYGTYYYILEEYRVSNELLTEDIYALQAAVQRIHTYVSSLEVKVDEMQKKSGKA